MFLLLCLIFLFFSNILITRVLCRPLCSFLPFPKRFGEWAIVTGSTDGIGKAIALELAKKGMNLILISRSYEKLESTKNSISNECPKCSIQTFSFDFSFQSWNTESLIQLKSIINKLDIGILVNNVGVSYPSALKFEELPNGLIDDLISVNIRSVYHLTQMVLPGMRERMRGAILCIGSGASELPSEPLYAGYVGTKAAIEGFCRSLQAECVSDNVLVQCQTPLLVTTKLSKIKTASITVPSAQSYSVSAINTLENSFPSYCISSTSCPNRVHSIILFFAYWIPFSLWTRVRLSMTSSIRQQYLKKTKTQ